MLYLIFCNFFSHVSEMVWIIVLLYKSTHSLFNVFVILHGSLRMPARLDLSDTKWSFRDLLEETKCIFSNCSVLSLKVVFCLILQMQS